MGVCQRDAQLVLAQPAQDPVDAGVVPLAVLDADPVVDTGGLGERQRTGAIVS
jgi:hypothetical protein